VLIRINKLLIVFLTFTLYMIFLVLSREFAKKHENFYIISVLLCFSFDTGIFALFLFQKFSQRRLTKVFKCGKMAIVKPHK